MTTCVTVRIPGRLRRRRTRPDAVATSRSQWIQTLRRVIGAARGASKSTGETPMMDRIMAMRTFVRIVDTNSFTRAASSLGIPRASATTLLQSLEELLGIQLLVRTTRRLNLTAEGAAYYERCVQILADIDDIEASLQHTDDRPRGR